MLAAENGDLAKLKKYLSTEEMQGQQADVNAKGLDQWTALHLAAKSGHVEVVKVLLAQTGVEIEARSAAMRRTPTWQMLFLDLPRRLAQGSGSTGG